MGLETPVPRRLGPRPLPLHLNAAICAWSSSKLASALLSSGSIAWSQALKAEAEGLRAGLAEVGPERLQPALDREIARRLEAFVRGVAAYRRHPHRRQLAEPAAVAEIGSTRLLRYPARPAAGRRPLLLVPSLINRSYILDLAPRRSFARWLARRGFETLLVDWGRPGPQESRFTLSDYITERLEPLFERAAARSARRPLVVGYCMGGLLALALALRRPGALAGLALLATPWDFHAAAGCPDGSGIGRGGRDGAADPGAPMAALGALLEPLLSATGVLPVDLIQALFASRDPLGAARKFRAFAALDPTGPRARAFVELEDWLNDGVPLAAPVARECLIGWYGENRPARGAWLVDGSPVAPGRLTVPTLCMVPAQDRIVPPASAAALAAAVPGCDRLDPPAGHIGMMASQSAATAVWQPLVDWISARG